MQNIIRYSAVLFAAQAAERKETEHAGSPAGFCCFKTQGVSAAAAVCVKSTGREATVSH